MKFLRSSGVRTSSVFLVIRSNLVSLSILTPRNSVLKKIESHLYMFLFKYPKLFKFRENNQERMAEKNIKSGKFNKISVTLLSSYLYCKRKMFIEQVLGIREMPKEATVVGNIRHSVLDLVNKQEKGLVSSIIPENKEMIDKIYKESYSNNLKNAIKINKNLLYSLGLDLVETYKKLWVFFNDEASTRAGNIISFIKEFNVFGTELWERLTPKIESEVFVSSDRLELKGKIDRLEKHEDRLVPVEIKTGKAPKEGVWEGHLIQVAAYMLLLEDQFKKNTNEGIVDYINEKAKRKVKINPFLKDEVIKLKNKVKELLNSSQVPPMCNQEKKCERCGIREECFNLDN
ncbi:CRISPR-associated protein Cas4 [Candidatus Woesearchaeota archaeon]|nr:CRISPR-associated protein Cas4 [Candidatus Woesearchaeota archaeon]